MFWYFPSSLPLKNTLIMERAGGGIGNPLEPALPASDNPVLIGKTFYSQRSVFHTTYFSTKTMVLCSFFM
jgi:hypothetical protein